MSRGAPVPQWTPAWSPGPPHSGPLLTRHADRTEAGRQGVPEVMRALEDAGLFEVIVPERLGGLGAPWRPSSASRQSSAKRARPRPGCNLLNITTWAASQARAAQELFDSPQRPRGPGVLIPSGTACRVDGGYRVSGKWSFASGSFYATWFTGGVYVVEATGGVTGVGMVLAPRSDFRVENTWFVAGMNGTASNTVVLDDVFVPTDHLTPLGEEAPRGSDPRISGPSAPRCRWF